ncbi:hypothetical protein CBM2589_A90355 [Cupriavidus taiwanensis]|uniref:Uncharacterized protein n=1 Tax=Cupriavidus taiwanensis TaxID=164546 RepID=A0A976A9B2_9BURK|nr:hypothetical protein CBM2589_A90355 [Cupriavidus taiwanensis]
MGKRASFGRKFACMAGMERLQFGVAKRGHQCRARGTHSEQAQAAHLQYQRLDGKRALFIVHAVRIVTVANDQIDRILRATGNADHRRPAAFHDRHAAHGSQSQLHGFESEPIELVVVARKHAALHQRTQQPIRRAAVQTRCGHQRRKRYAVLMVQAHQFEQIDGAKHRLGATHAFRPGFGALNIHNTNSYECKILPP